MSYRAMQLRLGYGSVQKRRIKAMAVGNTQALSLSVDHVDHNKDIEFLEDFQYLGSNISTDGDTDYDIYTLRGKDSSVHSRLCPVWCSKMYDKDAYCFLSFSWPPYGIGQDIIFCPVVSFFFYLFSFLA